MIIDGLWLWSWVVQGTAVVAVVALALRLRPAVSASTRALVWAMTLAALPCIGLAQGAGVDVRVHAPGLARPLDPVSGSARAAAVAIADRAALAVPSALSRAAGSATTVVVWTWVLLAVLRLVRLGHGLWTLARWRRRCRLVDPTAWHRLPAWMSLRDRGRRADIVVSIDVRSPCVLGFWPPVIALPPSALTIRSDALDAVLVHEYAHVQRRDDVAQFVQHLVTALCALHPGAWWASRMLSLEREAACDDWAVLLAMPTRTYASSLMALATGGRLDTGMLPVGAIGGRSQLGARICRLVDAERQRRLRPSWHARVVVPLSIVLLAGGVTAAGPPRMEPPPALTVTYVSAGPSRSVDASASRGPIARPAATTPSAGGPPRRIERRARAIVTDAGSAARHRSPPAPAPAAARTGLHVGTDVETDVGEAGGMAPAARTAATAVVSLPAATTLTLTTMPASPPAVPVTRQAQVPAQGTSETARAGGPFTEAGLTLAQAGISIGKGAARGGVATGTFFTRLGKRVAGTF